jgi:hypothetical protein
MMRTFMANSGAPVRPGEVFRPLRKEDPLIRPSATFSPWEKGLIGQLGPRRAKNECRTAIVVSAGFAYRRDEPQTLTGFNRPR